MHNDTGDNWQPRWAALRPGECPRCGSGGAHWLHAWQDAETGRWQREYICGDCRIEQRAADAATAQAVAEWED